MDARSVRVPAMALTLALTAALSVVVGSRDAGAEPGPAPAPADRVVIADVHTDAISTFWDDGGLVLASKADTPELGTRYEAEQVWFHVDDDSRRTVPSTRPFIAPEGTQVWIAPQSFAVGQLWPGFSTEDVPDGTLDGDTTTLTLLEVDGPGDFELYLNDVDGAVRQWSSDEDFTSFNLVGRTHMHTNWAFTEAGTYELTVQASGTVDGSPVSDTAVYTFVVGELPEQVTTTIDLQADGDTVAVGGSVELHATVAPAGVEGYVEFRDGSTVLGHEELADGAAEFEATGLGIGTHSVTAHFVPKIANLASTSESDPVTITVTGEGGVPFAITGIQSSYEAGDTLTAEVAGYALEEGQQFSWLVRNAGEWEYWSQPVQTGAEAVWSKVLSVMDDATQIAVAVREGSATVAQTGWVPIVVEPLDGERPVLTRTDEMGSPVYMGDTVEYAMTGRELAEGETIEYVAAASGTTFHPTGIWTLYFTHTTPSPTTSRLTLDFGGVSGVPVAYVAQVVRDGEVIARSPAVWQETARREVQIQGVSPLYREGATLTADVSVYPAREGEELTYTWRLVEGSESTVIGEEQQSSPAVELAGLTKAEHDLVELYVDVYNHGMHAGWARGVILNVTDNVEGQVVVLSLLAHHYHQGDDVSLTAMIEPAPLPDDELVWEWNWPGTDEWAAIPGASGTEFSVVAEQALDGVQVRLTLVPGDETAEPVVSDPRTIHHDDHGTAPRQQPTIGGATAYTVGDEVTLTRELPANGQTVLTEHRWERRAAGAQEWVVVDSEAGETLSFTAATDDDGAEYRVSLVAPDGEVAYGPSPAVALTVDPGTPQATVTVTGLAESYRAGDVVTLTATVDPVVEGARFEWLTRAAPTAEWTPVEDATSASYGFTATTALDGLEIMARVHDGDTLVGESAPVVLHVTTGGGEPEPPTATQRIVVTLPAGEGALVVSVDPEDDTVQMADFELGTAGDRWSSSGRLRPVTVTDTRSSAPGWAVSGQVNDFTADTGASLAGKHLGWAPTITAQPGNGGVAPGTVVAPGLDSGDGLAVSAPLAIAAAGSGFGTSRLGADLRLEAPTSLVPGTYEAVITFTAI